MTFSTVLEEKSSWFEHENLKDFPVFEVRCNQDFPFEETFIPMVKRALMSYVFQVVNFQKMRDLEE
jgi:hypothetical protein